MSILEQLGMWWCGRCVQWLPRGTRNVTSDPGWEWDDTQPRYQCSLHLGHAGPHIAYRLDGDWVQQWPQGWPDEPLDALISSVRVTASTIDESPK